MARFRSKVVEIEAITFGELIAHGLAQPGATIHNGMPWSFEYQGHPITHENDDCYLIPTLEGTMKMGRGDVLITGLAGEIYPCKREIFEMKYEAAIGDANASATPRRTHEDDRQTLLDMFAAHVAPAVLLADREVSLTYGDIAVRAYEAAEALLAERDRRIAEKAPAPSEPTA